ncbi:MAG TPA: hypothetical protein VMV37_07245 [Gammaproteobacteria bacterium]|nr:hypothetical protein [Gammaproteobacteria bacterium]
MRFAQGFSAAVLLLTLPGLASAATLTIPSGTKLYGELEQQITSNEKEFSVGQKVQGRVWRNVTVNGQIVIAAGAPMVLQISSITRRKIAGRGGDVKVAAMSVTAVDGSEINLDGGYDKSAGNRIALAASLSALVLWPLIFIRGKEAVLDVGTVFDASVPANTNVGVADDRPRTIRIQHASNLAVDVLYDEVEEKSKALPMKLTMCDQAWVTTASVTQVNEKDVPALALELGSPTAEGQCSSARATVGMKELSAHFARGINRFTVSAGSESVEVVLDVEM